jgi:hypothetical protein
MRISLLLSSSLLLALGCAAEEAPGDYIEEAPGGKADFIADASVCQTSADCAADEYCVEYTVYDWPRCHSLAAALETAPGCASTPFGDAPLLVEGTGFDLFDGANVYLAEASDIFSTPTQIHGHRPISGGEFSFDCPMAVSETYDYPSTHIWIDVDGDGSCDPATDVLGLNLYYGFGPDGVWDVFDADYMTLPGAIQGTTGPGGCEIFEALAEVRAL